MNAFATMAALSHDIGFLAQAIKSIPDGTPLTFEALNTALRTNLAQLTSIDVDPNVVALGEALIVMMVKTRARSPDRDYPVRGFPL